MLGLGLSLRSPRIIGTVSGGGGPSVQEFPLPYIGDPGPSSTSDLETQVFHTEVVQVDTNTQKVYVYEVILPSTNIDQILFSEIGATEDGYQQQVGTDSNYSTQNLVKAVSTNTLIAEGALVDTPMGVQQANVFQKFMEYLFENETIENFPDFFSSEYIANSTYTYIQYDENLNEALGQRFTFDQGLINAYANFDAIYGGPYLEYIYDTDSNWPDVFIYNTYNQDSNDAFTFLNVVFFRESIAIVDTTPTEQPVLTSLPAFGDAPTPYNLVLGGDTLTETGGQTYSSDETLVFMGIPSGTNPVYTLQRQTINSTYYEDSGIPLAGTDLFPLGMHTDGTVPITTFNTNFQISYTNVEGSTTTFAASIVHTNSGSYTSVLGNIVLKTFSYSGQLQIAEEDFPGLYASIDNGTLAIPVAITNIYNTVPNSTEYIDSNTIQIPFGSSIVLPVIGSTLEGLLEWLGDYIPGDVPGTSLSLIPASDNTYDATPPATNPTITHYTTTLPLKGVHVSFDGAVADLSTAYATSGTDLTFIAIGINKNVANTTEQLVVNRKTTTEGVGIKSDATYIKLKNASLPTDTTPAGVPTQDYQSYVPFFIYLEKTSTTASEYNEFNEEVKRYSVGANDILELNRITNNFAGSLSYIAVIDKALSATERARKIEHLRATYLDLNTPNRYE